MILILSKSQSEASTTDLIKWLKQLGATYLRINGADLIRPGNFRMATDGRIRINGQWLNPQDIRVVYNRRWIDPNEMSFDPSGSLYKDIDPHKLNYNLKSEFFAISAYLFELCSDAVWIPRHKDVNKLVALQSAKACGLQTPPSCICTSKEMLLEMMHAYVPLITKSVDMMVGFHDAHRRYGFPTVRVTREDIDSLPAYFFPSFFQQEIKKKVEIRTFYLLGEMYSMAIFSQRDAQTEVDFRHYNLEKPNRTVPFQLPEKVENQLRAFMQR